MGIPGAITWLIEFLNILTKSHDLQDVFEVGTLMPGHQDVEGVQSCYSLRNIFSCVLNSNTKSFFEILFSL